jgi:hypothetical protein
MEKHSITGGRGFLVFVALFFIVAGVFILWTRSRAQNITVTLCGDGQARLFGVPLGHGGFRRVVFFALFRVTKTDVYIAVPQNLNETNLMELSQAIYKAGWTNRHPDTNWIGYE